MQYSRHNEIESDGVLTVKQQVNKKGIEKRQRKETKKQGKQEGMNVEADYSHRENTKERKS
jgi:hypothetical protein